MQFEYSKHWIKKKKYKRRNARILHTEFKQIER